LSPSDKASDGALSIFPSKALLSRVKRLPHVAFGQNICRLRNERKLTQESLAEKADISRRFLQEIEAGTKNPTVNVIVRLKKALDCSWDDLFINAM
jgi:DNA-binding XRE family transcriptional regulator